jgi:SAM-dependent methyltransferase
VLDVVGLPSTATVLELGAGTGKLTRLLVSRFASTIALEPDEGMRALLVGFCPEVAVLASSAEAIPLAGKSVDAVFAAEAFQWFDHERSLAEIARVLRPRGALVLIWNLPAGPTVPSIEAVEQLLLDHAPAGLQYDPVDLNATPYASGAWRRPFENSPFEPLQETRIPNRQRIDRDGLIAFFESMGWLGNLCESERLSLLRQLRSLLDAPEYDRSWETQVHWTRLAA